MRRHSSAAFALLIALTATAARAEVKAGQPALDFDATTLAGAPLKLSSCKKELPLLDKLAPRLHARGVEIVAVNIDDNRDKAADFLKSHGLHLTVVTDGSKKIVGAWEPPKMPSSFVVDKAGVVRAVHGGFEPGDETKLEAELTSLVSR